MDICAGMRATSILMLVSYLYAFCVVGVCSFLFCWGARQSVYTIDGLKACAILSLSDTRAFQGCEMELEDLQKELAGLQRENELFRQRCSDNETELSESKRAYDKLKRESHSFAAGSEESHIYLKKESKRIKKLLGRPKEEGDVDVEEWIEDVTSYFESRKLGQRDRIEFIYEHVDGKVKAELRYRPEEDKRDAENILAIIQRVFGDSESLSALQEKFFRRVQKEGETLLEYSLALMQLFDKIQKCVGGGSLSRRGDTNADRTLKDKFTEGVRDDHLRRELRRLLMDDERLPFWMFRDRAIKYMGSEIEIEDSKNSKSTKSKAQVVNQQVTEVTGACNSQFMDMLKSQQEQISKLTSVIEGMKTAKTKPGFFKKKVDRVCYLCNEPGHIVRNCPKNPMGQGPQNASQDSSSQAASKPLN